MDGGRSSSGGRSSRTLVVQSAPGTRLCRAAASRTATCAFVGGSKAPRRTTQRDDATSRSHTNLGGPDGSRSRQAFAAPLTGYCSLVGPRALDRLRRAAADRSSGSAAVAAAAADAIAAMGAPGAADAVLVLLRGQPFMAACIRLADEIIGAPQPGPAAARFARRLESERAGLRANLDTYLPRRAAVMTVSYSSVVIESLAGRRGLRVACAASEPGGEGLAAVRRLTESGVTAEIVPDSSVASAAARCDLVVVGADAVGPRAFLNKAGTLAAVLGAREAGVPRIALAGTSKFIDARTWAVVIERLPGAPPLDAVPLRRLTSVLTEEGPLQPAAAARLASRSRVRRKTLELLA